MLDPAELAESAQDPVDVDGQAGAAGQGVERGGREEDGGDVPVVENVDDVREALRRFTARGAEVRDIADRPPREDLGEREVVDRRGGLLAQIGEIDPQASVERSVGVDGMAGRGERPMFVRCRYLQTQVVDAVGGGSTSPRRTRPRDRRSCGSPRGPSTVMTRSDLSISSMVGTKSSWNSGFGNRACGG